MDTIASILLSILRDNDHLTLAISPTLTFLKLRRLAKLDKNVQNKKHPAHVHDIR